MIERTDGGARSEAASPQRLETGTTIVALACDETAVIAADRRASVGGGRFVANRDVDKVDRVHPRAAVAVSGSVAGGQALVDRLSAASRRYRMERDEPLSVDALATRAATLLRARPLPVQPILAGADDDGALVTTFDGAGGRLDAPYAALGSGMQLAYGVLEGRAEELASPADAREVATDAVAAAAERDAASGDGVTVVEIDPEGFERTVRAGGERA